MRESPSRKPRAGTYPQTHAVERIGDDKLRIGVRIINIKSSDLIWKDSLQSVK